jgi:catechol 2,3-dioxygenase-like lactoylglutathione lyase family enzyme
MRIGLTSIFVDDQDQAERFYTEVLGLKVKTSAPYGPEERWLTVVSHEEPDGVELVLHLADEPARAVQAASRQAGRPVLSLRSGSRPRGWCSSGNQPGWTTGAWTQSSPIPAATCSTCTRTDRRNRRATQLLIIGLRTRTPLAEQAPIPLRPDAGHLPLDGFHLPAAVRGRVRR